MIKILREDVDSELNRLRQNRTFLQLQKKCNECGYKLFDAFWDVFKSGKEYFEINLTPNGQNKYTPGIYVDRFPAEDKPYFSVQTTSYGSLDQEEYGKFIDAVNKAYELLDFINNRINLDDLERFNDKEF